MKKIVLALLSLLMAVTVTGCSGEQKDALERIKEQGYITVGISPDYAPNEFYIDNNGKRELVGYDVTIANAIAEEIGVKLVIQESDFFTVIANAQAGTIDFGISGFAYTKARDEVVDFSVSYARDSEENSWQGIMIRKEDVNKYTSKESFKTLGAMVGAQSQSIQYEMAQTIVDDKHITELNSTTDAAGQLSVGDLDAFICTSPQAFALMQTYDNIMILPEETFNMDPEGIYNQTGAIFCQDEAYKSLIEVVNKVLTEIQVKDETTGKSQLDIWYEEAVALMPFDLTEVIQAENAANE